MRTVHMVGAVFSLWVAGLGCDDTMSSKPSGSVDRVPGTLAPAPSRRTTSERIAVANLNASIDALRSDAATGLGVEVASELIEALMLRATYYGTFDDWDEALEVSKSAMAVSPDVPRAMILRARVLATIHEFDAAARLVGEALARGAVSTQLAVDSHHLQSAIRLAKDGASDELIARRRALASATPTYQNMTSLALALAEHGSFEEADAAFRQSLHAYRDVSPFPFAWVAFQRGVMWSELAGRPDLGRPFYEEALRYLPGYVLANVHLAEIEAVDGDIQSAIGRVEPLIGVTQDPEPLALLADLEMSRARARQYGEEADLAYRSLVERFPNAFSHHID